MNDIDRAATITIGGMEYQLLLTTRATKEIAKKYGGLSDLGDKLLKSENFELALDEIVWLITLLANQTVHIHNFQNPDNKRDLLTEEMVEIMTTPADLGEYKDAVMAAMQKGIKRNVVSESGGETKNPPGA